MVKELIINNKNKKCRLCGNKLVPIINWYPSSEKKGDYICIPCTKKRNEEYNEKNKVWRKKYKKKRYHKLKKEIVDYLGGKCILCGNTNQTFITLHHSIPMEHNCQPYHYQKYIDILIPLCWPCHDTIHNINNWLNLKEIYYGHK